MDKNQVTQMMREMVDAIKVRDHLYTMVNGPRTSLISKTEERELRDFANQLDRHVVEASLAIKRGVLAAQAQAAQAAQVAQASTAQQVDATTARQAAMRQAAALKALEEEALADGATDVESGSSTPQEAKAAQEQPEVVPPAPVEKPKKKTTRKKGVVRRADPE
jgi:hypothetical protein